MDSLTIQIVLKEPVVVSLYQYVYTWLEGTIRSTVTVCHRFAFAPVKGSPIPVHKNNSNCAMRE